ncbi:Cox family DNA-binding protein [Erwinia aphidicola]|uniref:Cox family DNA-binding protein n=1 Tax=Erwinia aphidicola TaxID=68334 RepID=UPI0030D16832
MSAISDVSEVKSLTDAVTPQRFAEMIGKPVTAVRAMVDSNKLPLIEWRNPENPNARAGEKMVYIPEFNRAMRDAFYSRPVEQRDAWLLWLGLN